MSIGLYIHIPFCRKKCFYCDFYSRPYGQNQAQGYLDVLSRQLNACSDFFSSAFVGGGTPTVLNDSQFTLLLKTIGKQIGEGAEFTVEANPESLNAEKIEIMLGAGVNRLSVGVQSFNDKKLKKLGRIHDAGAAREKILLAHKLGFKNISLDMIFGVEDESLSAWKDDLVVAVKLPVKHISAYALSYEKRTPLFKLASLGKVKPLSNSRLSLMYKEAMEFLPQHGFLQYEVSNFAKKGFACRHNLNYWDNGEYLGLGPTAASYLKGVRSRNVTRLGEYIKRVNSGKSVVVFKEKLLPEKARREAAAIKIRTAGGIDFDPLLSSEINALFRRGLVQYCRKNRGICLTRKGFLFCDEVSAALV